MTFEKYGSKVGKMAQERQEMFGKVVDLWQGSTRKNVRE